jgi:SHS2 domain-containing protein
MFEIFPHTADVGLRVQAADPTELFVEAARGFSTLLVDNLDDVASSESVSFTVHGTELDYLLFDWLHELLFTFEIRHLVFSRFEVALDADGLRATAHGEKLDFARHRVNHEVKAVTYHGFTVEEAAEGWVAEVIFDI